MSHYVLYFYSDDESCIHALPRPAMHELENIRFNLGSRIPDPLPVIEFIQGVEHQGTIPDYVPTDLPGITASAQFRRVLEQAGVDNTDYYPATIFNKITGVTLEEYWVSNIIGRVACISMNFHF